MRGEELGYHGDAGGGGAGEGNLVVADLVVVV